MIDFTALETQITRFDTAVPGVVLALKTFADEAEANKNAPAKIQELADKTRVHADTLAAAIVTGTGAGGEVTV